MTPAIDLGATPAVIQVIKKGLPGIVAPAWEELKDKLRQNPRFVPPDKRQVWAKAFKAIPNHRHADLPSAWRACWTIYNIEGGERERVTVIFLGSHKRYDRLYGFATS